jgi:hypothetical protein
MTTNLPHRMLVVHNLVGAGDRVRTIDLRPFRKYAFGGLLGYADDAAKRANRPLPLTSECLALPGDIAVYDAARLEGLAVDHKYDSVMCHLVLDHGGVLADDFLSALRADFLKPGGLLLNPVKSITKTDVARASRFELETETAPCVIKKNDNYNKPETVFQLHTAAELANWRAEHGDEQERFVMHKLLRYYGIDDSQLYQLERWVVWFDDLTINCRYSDEFYIKRATSLSFYARDERRLSRDLERLTEGGQGWKGRSLDCAYVHDPEGWDARYATLKNFREAFGFDYAELDVIQPAKGEFVVIDVNNTPGPSHQNVHWRELAVRVLAEKLGLHANAEPRSAATAPEPVAAAVPVAVAEATSAPVVETRADGSRRAEGRRNICLCMIVKDESEVLPRLFRSVKDYIDYYVIVDTGSTDDTIALIEREMRGYGIAGEVHERPWVNFGVNRQQALELAVAAGKSDWLLFIDADEELGVSDPTFYEKLEPGVSYDIEKHHAGTRYAVPHLVNVKASRFRWEGVVHNYLVTTEGSKARKLRHDVWIIYHHGQGAKSRGLTQEQKYLRDAKLLEEDLAKNPGNARSQFYLGQSYRDAGHHAKAYVEYKRRAQMQGWAEETFVAQLEAARAAQRIEEPEEVVVREYLEAYELRPTRVEPLHDLARYFRTKGKYGKAYAFARTGVELERPDDQLFINQQIYDWRMLDELSVAAYRIGDYPAAREAAETILRRVQGGRLSVPPDDLRRIQENLSFTLKRLGAT